MSERGREKGKGRRDKAKRRTWWATRARWLKNERLSVERRAESD